MGLCVFCLILYWNKYMYNMEMDIERVERTTTIRRETIYRQYSFQQYFTFLNSVVTLVAYAPLSFTLPVLPRIPMRNYSVNYNRQSNIIRVIGNNAYMAVSV